MILFFSRDTFLLWGKGVSTKGHLNFELHVCYKHDLYKRMFKNKNEKKP